MIELNHVSKHYGPTKALNDVTCSIEKGEIVGFVGPNGAGKSTTMKIITTYTAPTLGTVTVGDFDVMENPNEVRQLIGYLPEKVPLYDDMMVIEYLEFIGQARHLNGNFKQRFDWVVDAAGLESVLKKKINELSKGYRQRTCLAQALIHDPEVLILDEPTSGLDPLQIIGIRNLIKNLAHEKTILLSTHILQEVTNVCDRILVVNNGQLVGNGTFDDLRKQVTNQNSVTISVKSTKKDFEAALKNISAIEEIKYEDKTARGVVTAHIMYSLKKDILQDLNNVIQEQKWSLLEFQPEKLSLEESFIRLTQKPALEEGGES